MAVNAAPSGRAPGGPLAGRWALWLVTGLWVALAAVVMSGAHARATRPSRRTGIPAL
jgi:putative drug exporter of the RND superfamily